jgi:hypothetical protein
MCISSTEGAPRSVLQFVNPDILEDGSLYEFNSVQAVSAFWRQGLWNGGSNNDATHFIVRLISLLWTWFLYLFNIENLGVRSELVGNPSTIHAVFVLKHLVSFRSCHKFCYCFREQYFGESLNALAYYVPALCVKAET